tara:strand:+ start:81 stop:1088 length:1008 start_codon:yes stop_codon:yes gene_type:complete
MGIETSFDRLLEDKFLLADGATGTNLFLKGLLTGDAPELWNLNQSNKIFELHTEFLEAGSQLILTNSFGGSSCRLKLHNAEKKVREINFIASEIAKECADKFQETKLVAGSVGPTGELFEPLGLLTYDDAVEIFHEQMDALKSGGADFIWIETLSALDELKAAIDAANRTGLPTCCTLSFDTHDSTMMGIGPETFVRFCEDSNLFSYGANCGVGPSEMVDTVLQIKKNQNIDLPIIAKGNCGIPAYQEGKIVYSGTPEIMSRYALMAFTAGAKIIGGCCGTTAQHIRAMRNSLEKAVISATYSAYEHFSQLGRPWQETDKSKKSIKRSSLRKRNL